MITVEITYCERDYLRAVKFMSRRQSMIVNGLVLLGVVVVVLMAYRANHNELGWWVKPLGVGWLTFFVVLFRMVQVRSLGKQLKSTPAAQGSHVWMLSDEGVRLTGPLTTGDIKWEAIIRARESEGDFFFYTAKRFALFLPKRVLANERQMLDLRLLIGEKLGNKASLM